MADAINKIKYGLKNVHYALVTEVNGVVSYATPEPIYGAVNLVLNAASEQLKVPADDNPEYYVEEINNGYEGNLEMQNIPDAFYKDVYGRTEDANGALFEKETDVKSKIALMYEFDGDQKKTRHIDYNVFCSRPNVSSATKTNTKTPVTDSIPVVARPAIDTGAVRARAKYGDAAYANFFTAVYLEDAPINTVAAAAVTFSKAAPADLAMSVTSSDGTNTVRNVLLNGVWIPSVSLTVTGVDVTLAQAYIALLANGVYTVTIQFARGNAITVTLTVTA